jgi:MFS family permease
METRAKKIGASAIERDSRMTKQERYVVVASSLGTVFEWYDFFLVGALASYISKTFFSGINPTAGFIFTLLSFAAGFAVRPFGAIVFGRLGDMVDMVDRTRGNFIRYFS